MLALLLRQLGVAMTFRFVRKARAARLLGMALVLAGLACLLYVSALVSWQITARMETGAWVPLPAALLFDGQAGPRFVPELPAAWLAMLQAWPPIMEILQRLHIGLLFALPGALLGGLGAYMVVSQRNILRLELQRAEDRLRRVAVYRESARREPYIGPAAEEQPRSERRRVA
jgi:hypothetical protein